MHASQRAPVRRETLEVYEEDLLGIPVVLRNAVLQVTDAAGDVTFEIPDMDGLVATVAMTRALTPWKLTGRDIRFLRKAMGMTGREFAEAMATTPETVSRWEHDGQAIGGFAEKGLRNLVCVSLKTRAPGVSFKPEDVAYMKIMSMREQDAPMPPMEFRRVVVVCPGSGTETDAWYKAAA